MSTARALLQLESAHPTNFQHAVQFYEEDSFLIEALGRHFAPLLANGAPALVVATKVHREALRRELGARGINVAEAAARGVYVERDAKQTLSRCMLEGRPDQKLFEELVGGVLAKLEAKANGREVAAFGEMVALLWEEGNHEAAIQLERLWNELASENNFSLLCAYRVRGFDREKHVREFFSICGEHTDVSAGEIHTAASYGQQPRRVVGRLQQHNQALEHEIELSRQRVQLLQASADAGTWEMDLLDDNVAISSRAARILGIRAGQLPLQQFTGLMAYSGDRDNFSDAIRRARTGKKEFVTEFRIRRSGEVKVLSVRGRGVYNGGQPLLLGVLTDITPKTL